MKHSKQLAPEGAFFVGGETSRVYQHTGGLILLDSEGRADFGFDTFRRKLEARIEKVPQFRWKLHEVFLGLDLPYWVEDENFSFDHHIRRIAVPSPGDRAALGELVAYIYSRHMDRNRPLWETWFVEGLADGKFALVQKLHHCMMDGEGASRLGEILNDLEPDATPRTIDPAISGALPGAVPTRWEESFNVARRLYRLPLQAGREVFDAVLPSIRKRITRRGGEQARPPTPLAHFNADISADRGFVFGSLSLPVVKAVKSHFDVTVNDVVLALVAGSLRNYLLEEGALPQESLRTSMPVSLRTDADENFSNRVTSVTVTLATAESDPAARLRAIAEESTRAKQSAHSGSKGFMEYMQMLPPLLVNTLVSNAPPGQAITMVGANLLVSSVRGSARPMYIGGARQTAMYPISILTPGMGINFTCISYADNIDFGITVEPDMFPDAWRLIDGLHTALGDYQQLVNRHSGSRKKTAARTRPAGRKRTATKRKA